MPEFKIVPLSLKIRGTLYRRGEVIHFDKLRHNGTLMYRLQPKEFKANRNETDYDWFTSKQINAMQPHWITKQEELDL